MYATFVASSIFDSARVFAVLAMTKPIPAVVLWPLLTTALATLFQVRKQYEGMKREVKVLAKQHQRDVQALDSRFKAKMAGLASRFKQVEAEEHQMALVRQENSDLQAEILRLVGMMEVQDRQNDAHLNVISEKEHELKELGNKIGAMHKMAEQLKQEQDERTSAMSAAQQEMESTMTTLQVALDRKRADLVTMQDRLASAKTSYDSEVTRKQNEVIELEASLRQLHAYTNKMGSFVGQVQEQVMAPISCSSDAPQAP